MLTVGTDDYKTRAQTARILKVSTQTVDRYAKQGLIATVKCGPRRILIPTTEIEKLLTSREAK